MAKAEAARLHGAMMEIINGKLLSRCVSLAAELAIADHLRNGAKDRSFTRVEEPEQMSTRFIA